jgi:2,3-dihydroxybenzoate decarboxylase
VPSLAISSTGFADKADRVLYSVDYPYEDVVEAQTWLDHCPISDADRTKVANANSRKLFRL